MRTILAILLMALLLAAPLAAADREDGRSSGKRQDDDARENRTAALRVNKTDDDHERRGPRDANATANWTANRTALFDRIMDRLASLRESWTENATKVREACHAKQIDHANASKDNRTALAHCIRDGYAKWRSENRAEMKELRAELAALLGDRRAKHSE
jgi:gas vesicle protein